MHGTKIRKLNHFSYSLLKEPTFLTKVLVNALRGNFLLSQQILKCYSWSQLNNLVKGLLIIIQIGSGCGNNYISQRLQDRNGYSESPEFSPALGLFIFQKGILNPLFTHARTHARTHTHNHITCCLVCMG